MKKRCQHPTPRQNIITLGKWRRQGQSDPQPVLAWVLPSPAYTYEQGSLKESWLRNVNSLASTGFISMTKINFFLSYDQLNPHLQLYSQLPCICVVTQILSVLSPTLCAAISALGDFSRHSVHGVCRTWYRVTKRKRKSLRKCPKKRFPFTASSTKACLPLQFAITELSVWHLCSFANALHFMNEVSISAQATIPFMYFRRD